jgi:hypothetical protein
VRETLYLDCQGPGCSNTFKATRKDAKYCGVACRVAALRKRRDDLAAEPEATPTQPVADVTPDMPVRKRYVRRRELSSPPPVEKWRRKPSPEQAQGMAKLARKVVLPEDPYEDWGDGPVIGAG